jgi:tRNA pseudouridine38-40 synthase
VRWRFIVEYNGAAFAGWQVQPHDHTVQAELEHAFSVAVGLPVRVWGSGRTDAGVHARGQVAVAVPQAPEFPDGLGANSCAQPPLQQQKQMHKWLGLSKVKAERLQASVNGISNENVCIRQLQECSDAFNPRFDAKERYYIYSLYTQPVVLGRETGWDCSGFSLNEQVMQQEAQSFLGEHDFNAYSIPRNDGKSTLCTLYECSVKCQNNGVQIHIRGNRFLHRMVRSMVGLLVDVGRGKHPQGSVQAVFNGTFTAERTWAPACGLVLEQVNY